MKKKELNTYLEPDKHPYWACYKATTANGDVLIFRDRPTFIGGDWVVENIPQYPFEVVAEDKIQSFEKASKSLQYL